MLMVTVIPKDMSAGNFLSHIVVIWSAGKASSCQQQVKSQRFLQLLAAPKVYEEAFFAEILSTGCFSVSMWCVKHSSEWGNSGQRICSLKIRFLVNSSLQLINAQIS